MKKRIQLSAACGLLCAFSLVACGTAPNGNSNLSSPATSEPIFDSNVSFAEAIGDREVPPDIKSQLSIVDVQYYALDGRLHRGQIVVHKSLKEDVISIFKEIERNRFPVAKVIPISKYNFSDDLSMLDNNTSAFNYRVIAGTNKLSAHALGRAIDINPLFNPFVHEGVTEPRGAKYDPRILGTIVKDGFLVGVFKSRGWTWGGDWISRKDYQHFEKTP